MIDPNDPVIIALRQDILQISSQVAQVLELFAKKNGEALVALDARLDALEMLQKKENVTRNVTEGREL